MLLNQLHFLAETEGQFTQLLKYFAVDTPFLVAQIINFVIVAFVLYRFAFKPILVTIDARQHKIADGLQYAEEMKKVLADAEKQHAEKVAEASRKAQSIIDDAREAAKTHLELQKNEAAVLVESMLEKSRQSIAADRENMFNSVRSEITGLVVQTCEKVLSKNLSKEDKSNFNSFAAEEIKAAQVAAQ